MGLCRFLYDNLITSGDMITVSSQAIGLVTKALKQGTGSAIINTGGVFSGLQSLEYAVKIDSVTAGTGIGQATFKWSEDGGESWEAAGIATSADIVSLSHGVNVKFTSVGGDDFALNDTWFFKGVSPFSAARMLDLSRDSRWRSGQLQSPNSITIDLGEPGQVAAVILHDHNLTEAADIVLKADPAADWENPDFEQTVPWVEDRLLRYLDTPTTERHWRLEIDDSSNPDGCLEIGELYLGPFLELSRTFQYERQRTRSALLGRAETDFGVGRNRFFNLAENFEYTFGTLTGDDLDSLSDMFASISDLEAGMLKPIWFNEDSAKPQDFRLVGLTDLPDTLRFNNLYGVSLALSSVLRSV